MTCRFLLFLRVGIEAPPCISVTRIITDMKIPQETAFVKPFLRMILKIVHSAAFPAPGFGICAQNDRPRGHRAAGREEKDLRICAGRAHDRCRGGHAATDEMSWDMRCTTGGAEEAMTFPPHPLRCAQHLLLKEKALHAPAEATRPQGEGLWCASDTRCAAHLTACRHWP